MQASPLLPDPAPLAESIARHLEALLDLRQRLPEGAPSEVKRRLTLAIQVASSPACPESQADGVPCASVEGSCDHCGRALRWLEGVRQEMEDSLRAAHLLRRDPPEI